MKVYEFKPGNCISDPDGTTYRPFYLDGDMIYKLNIEKVMNEDKIIQNEEMQKLCDAIKEKTGCVISLGELPHIIKTRKIEKVDLL